MSEPNLYKIDADLKNLAENVRRGQDATETALREQRAETAAYREKQVECLNKLTELTGQIAASVEKMNGFVERVHRDEREIERIDCELRKIQKFVIGVSATAGGGVAVVSEILGKLIG